MAFLNPSAEPFTPPKLDSTAVSDAVNELPPIDGAEGLSLNELFAALLPHHQLRFERGNVKVYKVRLGDSGQADSHSQRIEPIISPTSSFKEMDQSNHARD